MSEVLTKHAISLRKEGWSYRAIAKHLLGSTTKKSTIQDWVKKYNTVKNQGPKILFIDIETAPAIAAAFGRRKVFLSDDHILAQGGFILTYAYAWGTGEVKSAAVTPEEVLRSDDRRLVDGLWELFNEADAVVAHHGNKFDIPMINTRLAVHKFNPLPTVKLLDTKVMASKKFNFPTNKLSTLAAYLGLQQKTDPGGIKSWLYVMAGKQEAIDSMIEYNENDVEVLRQIYFALARFGHNGSNFNAAHYYENENERCSVCGSEHIQITGRKVYTDVSSFDEVRCQNCGAVGSRRAATNTKEKRKAIIKPQRILG